MKNIGQKVRLSGMYLSRETVEAVDRIRRKGSPILTFNQQLIELIHEALDARRTRCQEIPRKWRT